MKRLERWLLIALSLLTLFLFDATADRIRATYFNVPTGIMLYSKNGVCPAGWVEHTDARGRYIVGLVSGGTLSATVGTPLTNSENRIVGQHNHIQDAHNHMQDSHNHTQDSHNHTQNSHNHTQDAHTHSFTTFGNTEVVGIIGSGSDVYDNSGTFNTSSDVATNQATTAVNQAATTTNQAATATNQAATPTNQSTGSVANTNGPYIQLIACRKG